MRKYFEKIKSAEKKIAGMDIEKVTFVSKAYNAYISEAAKIDDELNFIGHQEECKKEWLCDAILSEVMTEQEFDGIFELLEILGTSDAMAFC